MAATLNSFLGNLDKIPQYIDECKALGIQILKPDINKSGAKFTPEYSEEFEEEKNECKNVNNAKLNQKLQIRFGLGSI